MVSNVMPVIKKELKSYFNSPIAYVLVVTFLVFSSVWVFYLQSFFASNIASLRSFFSVIPIVFIIVMPALTMRSWAEEKKLGTMEVLMTLPFRESTLVLGKFIAALSLLLIMILLTLPLPLLLSRFGDFDWGEILGQYIGVVLLGAAGIPYDAICKIHTGTVTVLEVGPCEVCLREVGPNEVHPYDVRPLELGPSENGSVESGPPEVGPSEVGSFEDGLSEVSPLEFGLPEVGLPKVSPLKDGSLELDTLEVNPLEVSLSEVGPFTFERHPPPHSVGLHDTKQLFLVHGKPPKVILFSTPPRTTPPSPTQTAHKKPRPPHVHF